jgi:hypothetical protein
MLFCFPSCMFILLLSGIPGCAKSALCNEILNMPGGLGDNRPIHSLEGDLTKGMKHLAVFFGCYIHRTKTWVGGGPLVLRSSANRTSIDVCNSIVCMCL